MYAHDPRRQIINGIGRSMAISGISVASLLSSAPPTLQPSDQRKHGHHALSLSDIDAQGSSVAPSPSATGKTGSKVDVTA